MYYTKEIIAVVDPMCSWCWGFAPVLEDLQKSLPQTTKLTVCMGGLRSSTDQAWTQEFRTFLQQSWQKVHEQTGQEFNFEILKREAFDYNTEPACRALITVREINPSRVFDFLHTLQEAFYTKGLDITSESVLISLCEEADLDKEAFTDFFTSHQAKDKTQADKYKARSMGANAFPSLVFIDEQGHLYLLKGYRSFEAIKKHL